MYNAQMTRKDSIRLMIDKTTKSCSCGRSLKERTSKSLADLDGHITMSKAVLILILNLLLPGIGTIISVYFVKVSTILEIQRSKSSSPKVTTSFVFHLKQIRKRGKILGLL